MKKGIHATPEEVEAILKAYAKHNGNVTRTASEAGCDRNTVYRLVDKHSKIPPYSFSEHETGAVVELVCNNPIQTEDDAIRFGQIDTSRWYVASKEVTSWPTVMKRKDGDRDVITVVLNWRVKLNLKPILNDVQAKALGGVFARMMKHAPKYPKPPASRKKPEPVLMTIGLYDHHFGKLAWARESGMDYDLKIAEDLWRNAIEDSLARARHRNIDQILFGLGNDFLHIDNQNNTTTKGTPQDTDGRLAKIVEVAITSFIWAVERAMYVAPTHIRLVAGNHDETVAQLLAMTVKAWFRNTKGVAVDSEPTSRKYHRYGTNLIGMTHGNKEPVAALPGLMKMERKKDYYETECQHWHIGHTHTSRKWTTKSVDTVEGTEIWVMPSLSATDRYHYQHGYIQSRFACHTMYYGRETGFDGMDVVKARRSPT
jgi:predicted phosphodiesterase